MDLQDDAGKLQYGITEVTRYLMYVLGGIKLKNYNSYPMVGLEFF